MASIQKEKEADNIILQQYSPMITLDIYKQVNHVDLDAVKSTVLSMYWLLVVNAKQKINSMLRSPPHKDKEYDNEG
jgi:hypothetical protein